MKRVCFKKDNKGYSLLELIVVVAIISACVGLLSMSISIIPAKEAQKCAKELDAALSQCKIDAMSRSEGRYMTLFADDDGNVCCSFYSGDASNTLLSTEILGNRRCTCSIDGEVLSLEEDTANIESVSLSFARGTGAFDFSRNGGTAINKITVSGGGRIYTLTLYPATGAHILEVAVS